MQTEFKICSNRINLAGSLDPWTRKGSVQLIRYEMSFEPALINGLNDSSLYNCKIDEGQCDVSPSPKLRCLSYNEQV